MNESSRKDKLSSVISKCRERLAAGDDFQDSAIIEQNPDLMPALSHELKKLRLVETARREARRTDAAENAKPLSREAGANRESDRTETRAPNADLERKVGDRVRYFGDYELLEEIARGGMGVVYKARQVSLNRIVALKMILSGQFASEQDVQRFYTEAEAAANLDHPNIVPIHEVGQHDGQHYFSMGYVEGEGLDDTIRESSLPPRKAAEYTKIVAEAIHHAHEQGVLHRDIKPSNVLIDKNGQPRVTDFGLAKKTDSDSDLTATGQILGTPNYMPPEQAFGEHDQITVASDVYSLGALLYALLTGRPPFQAENAAAILMQVIDEEPIPPTVINSQVDRDMETICLKCLEKGPFDRYPAAIDVADELARYLRGEPIHSRPLNKPARTWRWCKRHPIPSALGAATIAAILVGALISIMFALKAERQAGFAERERIRRLNLEKIADDNKTLAHERELDAMSKAALADRERARADAQAAILKRTEEQALALVESQSYKRDFLAAADKIMPSDGWVDIQEYIIPERDVVLESGATGRDKWKLENPERRYRLQYRGDGRESRLRLPFRIASNDYEFLVDVEREEGEIGLSIGLPTPLGPILIEISHHNQISLAGHADSTQSLTLRDKERSTLRCKVSQSGQDSLLDLFVADEPIGQWVIGRASVERGVATGIRYNPEIAVLDGVGNLTFHKLSIRVQEGFARALHVLDYKRYGIESGIVVYEKSRDQSGEEILYFDQFGAREAIHTNTTLTTKDRQVRTNQITILNGMWMYAVDRDKNVAAKYKNTITVRNMREPAWTSKLRAEEMTRRIGGEKIREEEHLGYTCDVWEIEKLGARSWVWNSIPLKTEVSTGDVSIATKATSIELDVNIPDERFVVPAGVRINNMLNR